jgi:N-acetylglucosamine-6-phosphate deacetylase
MSFLRRKRWEIHFIVAVIFKRCMQLQTSQATHIAEGMAPFHVVVANIVAVIFNHCYRWMSLRRLVDSSHIVAVIFKCRKHFKRRLVHLTVTIAAIVASCRCFLAGRFAVAVIIAARVEKT